MKKTIITALSIIGLFTLISCDKFLELQPRDKKVVRTVEDYRDIMASYLYFVKTPNRPSQKVFGGQSLYPLFDMSKYLGIYTGEATLTQNNNEYYDKNKGMYTAQGKKILTWMTTEPDCWNRYNSFLGPVNLVIQGVQKAEGDNEDLRNYILGEALVWRAFSFYKLLQYYSPYQKNDFGIPVYLKPTDDIGNAMPKRNTQKEVFEQIFKDCNDALALLEITASNDWNCAWREDFINAMLASVYSWKALSGAAENSDWANAQKCADIAMKGRKLTNDPEILRKMFDSRDVTTTSYMSHDEFYFRIMDGDNGILFNYVTSYYKGSLVDGVVNYDYYLAYDGSDIRKTVFFTPDGIQSDKYNLLGLGNEVAFLGIPGGCLMPFRLAEMYLIKAEALARQGNTGEASKVLKEFKQSRYTKNIEIPSGADEILQEILDERLREFYMENDMRWLDMKRLGVRMQRVIAGERFTLEPHDFRYTFPIPEKEMALNKNMVQNPGWENILQN